MARKPRVAPDFSPEELDQISRIQRDVLDNPSSPPPAPSGKEAVTPISPTPGLGMRTGKAGGFWYSRGGVTRAPGSFAEGGPPLLRGNQRK